MTVCHCRPTARRARQVLTVIQWVVRIWEQGVSIVSYVRNLRLTQTRKTH